MVATAVLTIALSATPAPPPADYVATCSELADTLHRHKVRAYAAQLTDANGHTFACNDEGNRRDELHERPNRALQGKDKHDK